MPRLDGNAIRDAARGRWPAILRGIGIAADHLRDRHGPCPGCGGRDRFRFDDQDGGGSFYCSGGGSDELAGDGFALVMHVRRCAYPEALRIVADATGGTYEAPVARQPEKAPVAPSDEARRAEARRKAARLWSEAKPCTGHPYLTKKGIKPHGSRLHAGRLVIPVRDSAGTLHSLQLIDEDGGKRFLSGGRIGGCYVGIGKPAGVLCIAEGFATGASVHEASGHATACAFSANNLPPVAKALRAKYPGARIILCADDDEAGRRYALEAAQAVGGEVALSEVQA